MKDRVLVDLYVRHKSKFIEDLVFQGISLYSIEYHDDYLSLIVDRDDYLKLIKSKVIKKSFIREYYGKGKIEFFLRKYGILFLFFLFGLGMNIFFSHLILDIDIVTSNQTLKKVIEKDLEEFGVRKYHFRLSYSKKEELKNKLLEKDKDLLEWIEIDENGTKFRVLLEEKKLKSEVEECPIRNIVSRRNAILTKIMASEGEVVKKINDYVEKGETLVSGAIHNGEEEVARKCADGVVYGEVWYRVIVEVPNVKVEREKTGKSSFGFFFSYLGEEYIFPKKYEVFEKVEYNIIKSDVFPIQIGFSKNYELRESFKKYSSSEVLDLATIESMKKIHKEYDPKGVLLKKNVLKKTIKDSKIIIELFLAVEEDITDYGVIPDVVLEEE